MNGVKIAIIIKTTDPIRDSRALSHPNSSDIGKKYTLKVWLMLAATNTEIKQVATITHP